MSNFYGSAQTIPAKQFQSYFSDRFLHFSPERARYIGKYTRVVQYVMYMKPHTRARVNYA